MNNFLWKPLSYHKIKIYSHTNSLIWDFWRGENTKQLKDQVDYASLFVSCFFPCNWILSTILARIVGPMLVASVHSLVLASRQLATLICCRWNDSLSGRDSCSEENGENDRWRTRHGMKYRHHTKSIYSRDEKGRWPCSGDRSILMPPRETLSLYRIE